MFQAVRALQCLQGGGENFVSAAGVNFIHIGITPPLDHSEVTFANVPVSFSSHFIDGFNTLPTYLAAERAAGAAIPGLAASIPEPTRDVIG
eukprot:CAMPEP_0113720676 /NCGR_PEP_ID=MMETSP0038_2-20120614/36621_1 /TAXON_ID=2898 /ORGANISM="Cryptomonas paramecium" /LENGTH=90 /DNA_ID=CAMNT_0000649423 /DNA_START=5 /DNA_END=277 /DNA_ORIENTATION=+ /assembly_acc=CAM_ASM_000170